MVTWMNKNAQKGPKSTKVMTFSLFEIELRQSAIELSKQKIEAKKMYEGKITLIKA